jgi:hypothetical protein
VDRSVIRWDWWRLMVGLLQVHSGATSLNTRGEGSIILAVIRLSKGSKVAVWERGVGGFEEGKACS